MDKEELAFKDRKTLAQLNEKDLLDIIVFLQSDRKLWINQFSKTHNESVDIQKQNQELKEQLDKYENPEDMTLMMMWCTEKVKDENEKLKKQLHEASITIQEMVEQDIECPSNCEKLEKILTQQKEFIKYLEDGIKSSLALDTINKQTAMYIYSTTLRKYKSIIGVSDENNIK